MIEKKILFIGGGAMATAIIDGLVSSGSISPSAVSVLDPVSTEKANDLSARYGITVASAPADVKAAEVIVLAFKPQNLPEAADMYRAFCHDGQVLISILAGISTEKLEAAFTPLPVIRVMPNLPLSVGAGAVGLSGGRFATEAHLSLAKSIFAPSGVCVSVPEDQLDAVTALSGSGPAYFCYLAEAMIEAAVREGLSEENARILCVETMRGTGLLLAKTNEDPAALRQRVTSKKGTTEAALNAMTESGFGEAVKNGVHAAAMRSRELGK